jgi:hypothetical protein
VDVRDRQFWVMLPLCAMVAVPASALIRGVLNTIWSATVATIACEQVRVGVHGRRGARAVLIGIKRESGYEGKCRLCRDERTCGMRVNV